MESAEVVQWVLDHISYMWVFIFMVIESSFIPFPSEIVVPPAAYRAAAENADMNVAMVWLSATAGALVGSLVNYGLAYYLGRPIIYGLTRKWGHLFLLDEQKLQYAEEYFNRHGAVSTFVGRLIPAVRQLISIPAGLAKMGISRFLIFTALGAGLWNAVLCSAGYLLQSAMPEDEMLKTVEHYNHEFKIICLVVAAVVIAFLAYKYVTARKKAKTNG